MIEKNELKNQIILPESSYVLGTTNLELQRLERQHAIWHDDGYPRPAQPPPPPRPGEVCRPGPQPLLDPPGRTTDPSVTPPTGRS